MDWDIEFLTQTDINLELEIVKKIIGSLAYSSNSPHVSFSSNLTKVGSILSLALSNPPRTPDDIVIKLERIGVISELVDNGLYFTAKADETQLKAYYKALQTALISKDKDIDKEFCWIENHDFYFKRVSGKTARIEFDQDQSKHDQEILFKIFFDIWKKSAVKIPDTSNKFYVIVPKSTLISLAAKKGLDDLDEYKLKNTVKNLRTKLKKDLVGYFALDAEKGQDAYKFIIVNPFL